MTELAPARRAYVRRTYPQKVIMVRTLCRRIEAGEGFADACRDPTLPQRSTIVAWLAADDTLRALVDEAEAAAAKLFPRRRAYHRWSPKVAAEVLARIEDGRGLREVCAEPDMPVHATVTRWLNERPDYAEAYRLARQAQADRLFDLAWRIALEATEENVATSRLKIQTLKWRVGKLAPRKYGPLKAQAPEAEDDEGGTVKTIYAFEVRRFARTPDNQVVETTRAVRGMTEPQIKALGDDVREGRLSLAELKAMEAPD